MPITKSYPPANFFALAQDYDSLKDTPEDTFLQSINVTQIDSEDIKRI